MRSMASESEGRRRRRSGGKLMVAVEDEALLARLKELLGPSLLDLEVVDPDVDPVRAPPEQVADLLVVRRSSVRPEDLRKFGAFTRKKSNPGLLVITEGADDLDRARLLSAGVAGVLESQDSEQEQREAVAALTATEHGHLRDPDTGHSERDPRLADFLSRSPRMRRFLRLVQRVVDSDSSLLITGETGVGKERLAHAIHNDGARRDGPFVPVNCGAIPEQLLESELFGHEEGAFTGASRRRRGCFELAHGGTIFLDEIGEMPMPLQVNLLSVLQRRSIQRVGGEESIPIDVRVMAATHRRVTEEVEAGRFRQDLYYRLNVVTLEIPPLRDRAEDIPDLVGSFIRHFRNALGRDQVDCISDDALQALMAYDWQGNVRELVNAIEHAIVMCSTSQISLPDLPELIRSARADGAEGGEEAGDGGEEAGEGTGVAAFERWFDLPLRDARTRVTAEFERAYLRAQLERSKGRIGRTAARAGVTPRSLYDKLKKHDLRKEDYR
jgi:DNA-binding NtrC family response regulator